MIMLLQVPPFDPHCQSRSSTKTLSKWIHSNGDTEDTGRKHNCGTIIRRGEDSRRNEFTFWGKSPKLEANSTKIDSICWLPKDFKIQRPPGLTLPQQHKQRQCLPQRVSRQFFLVKRAVMLKRHFGKDMAKEMKFGNKKRKEKTRLSESQLLPVRVNSINRR